MVNARWKAASIAATAKPGTLVIAGDTEVAVDGEVLGQPDDEAQAREHLERLSGREHQVHGAIALLGPDVGSDGAFEGREGVETTTVRFRDLGPEPSAPTSHRANGGSGRAPTRSRDWARRWSKGYRETYRT